MPILPSGKRRKVVFLVLLCFIFAALIGCSKEAKKERHWGRGEKYFAENKFKEAIIEYKNVLQIDPADVKARYKLGLAHLKVGQLREAYAEFSKSVELDPNLVEARLHGLQVVASGLPGVRELVREFNGHIVPPGDVAALAETLLRIERPRTEARAFDARLAAKFSWTEIARQFLAIYSDILTSSSAAPAPS
jgi:tetratricopeptide (TPR) repeat protein